MPVKKAVNEGKQMKPEYISVKEAIENLSNRSIIHCFAGMVGADWKKASVIKELKRAKKIAWIEDILHHNLAIEPADEAGWNCILRFDVQKSVKKEIK
jgi:hypothetical protein